jgi:hypothetical protein
MLVNMMKGKSKKKVEWDEDIEATPIISLGKKTVREWTK